MSRFDIIKDVKIKGKTISHCHYDSFEDFYNHNHDVHFLLHEGTTNEQIARVVFDILNEDIEALENIIIDLHK